MTSSVTITVVTANIGRGVTADVAHANIHRIATSFPGAFVGFQEIDEADAPDETALVHTRFPTVDEPSLTPLHDVLAAAGRETYDFAGFSGPGWKRATPIAVPTSWRIVRQSVRTAEHV